MPCLQAIDVYNGEDPSKFEGWLDAVEQACNMTNQESMQRVNEKVIWSHQRDNINDEHSLDR